MSGQQKPPMVAITVELPAEWVANLEALIRSDYGPTDVAGGSTGQRKAATTWDYIDKARVTVQRNGVTRMRPAFLAGWRATFLVAVLLPEYITPADLNDVLVNAGRLVGLGDFRPTYGRFAVKRFEVAGEA